MYDFNYHKPDAVADAVSLFNTCEDAMYLAGGHTLIPTMKQRLRAPSDLIDLSGIEMLGDIQQADDSILIGAAVTHSQVAESTVVADALPVLVSLASGIGDRQVRNRGTMGGSVANSDPAADYPAAVLGLGATIITDRREISSDDFFLDMFETALGEDELITGIRFPTGISAAYVKFPNPASRYATVGVLVAKTATGVRVAVTGAAASVFRATAMEEALGNDFSVDALAAVKVSEDDMNADIHASAAYRAHLCGVMAARAVALIA
ncbi:MAG: xanthine dehydrogenase family protein subunit M [Gammaproteobacteria bacterium]|jgi:aerobic carbon-monoxide dehydrogenase medium subunit|nr:xanthine dehydrogenase family protein subunit M [Gammaproteobacteria bacterium]MBT5201852.1 xanthine dehydrogenase family protein subunit M [Gammaproteobacteria bacterium]MBT5600753.1 xanthine dehydrogenase family protein subunit M [Gammaproteobacteria bacterium]MBT6244200.1 xanthine dehydrogenase family protein subunit M [Gammaproteobacteria bacterium]